MERDIHKLAEYLEKKLKEGLADERLLREVKLSQNAEPALKTSAENQNQAR